MHILHFYFLGQTFPQGVKTTFNGQAVNLATNGLLRCSSGHLKAKLRQIQVPVETINQQHTRRDSEQTLLLCCDDFKRTCRLFLSIFVQKIHNALSYEVFYKTLVTEQLRTHNC